MSDLEQIGGSERLEAIVDRFVRRMASDFVIGFLFEGKDLERIAFHEAELAAVHLSRSPPGSTPAARATYSGRSLPSVHAPMRIHRGHFERRLSVLAKVLRESSVPEDIIGRWIAHDRELMPAIASSDDCAPRGEAAR